MEPVNAADLAYSHNEMTRVGVVIHSLTDWRWKMPQFELVSLEEAEARTASPGKRTQIVQEYLSYITQLKAGQAGKLQPDPGVTVATVRRRLGTAVKASGKTVVIKRTGDDIYFWVEQPAKRRGRLPKSAS